jgi:hypothetical protein
VQLEWDVAKLQFPIDSSALRLIKSIIIFHNIENFLSESWFCCHPLDYSRKTIPFLDSAEEKFSFKGPSIKDVCKILLNFDPPSPYLHKHLPFTDKINTCFCIGKTPYPSFTDVLYGWPLKALPFRSNSHLTHMGSFLDSISLWMLKRSLPQTYLLWFNFGLKRLRSLLIIQLNNYSVKQLFKFTAIYTIVNFKTSWWIRNLYHK